MNNIKVLHIITGLSLGGTEIMLSKLIRELSNTNVANAVISLTNMGEIGSQLLDSGVPTYSIGMNKKFLSPISLARLRRLIIKVQPDIIQTWLYHADLLGAISGRLSGFKNIVWNIRQSNLSPSVNKTHTLLTAKICSLLSKRLPSKIICNSIVASRAHIEFGYAPDKIKIIANGFDLDSFKFDANSRKSLQQELNVNGTSSLIGFIARQAPQKDHGTFIEAARLLLQKMPDAHFVCCGTKIDWNNEELTSKIDSSGLRHNFHLLGKRSDIPAIMSGLDIATSCSLGEGFSNAIGEAMACGTYCVATDVGDSKKIIGNTGKVVPAADPQSLYKAWLEYLTMENTEKTSLSKRARERVKKYFSIQQVASQYKKVYAELVGTTDTPD